MVMCNCARRAVLINCCLGMGNVGVASSVMNVYNRPGMIMVRLKWER